MHPPTIRDDTAEDEPPAVRRRPPACAPRRRMLLAGGGAMMAAMTGAHATTDSRYPAQPITVVVPFATGGQGDVFARLIGERLGQALGQAVIVDNRPGASGSIGARSVARAKPDGHTLLMGQPGEIVVNGAVMKQPGYDTTTDFTAVAWVADAPLLMVAPAGAPYDTVTALLALSRAKPGEISYASSGPATPPHIASAALAIGTGTDMIHVPYKGAGQALPDVIGGRVHFLFASTASAMPHVKSGRLKVLAVSTSQRVESLPTVPTIAESVLPGFHFSLWCGLFAPSGTPAPVIARLNGAVNDILREPAIRARFVADGAAIEPSPPERFAQWVGDESRKYADIIRTAGIRID